MLSVAPSADSNPWRAFGKSPKSPAYCEFDYVQISLMQRMAGMRAVRSIQTRWLRSAQGRSLSSNRLGLTPMLFRHSCKQCSIFSFDKLIMRKKPYYGYASNAFSASSCGHHVGRYWFCTVLVSSKADGSSRHPRDTNRISGYIFGFTQWTFE